MSVHRYKLTLICAAWIGALAGLFALFQLVVNGNWADTLSGAALALAAAIVAAWAVYRLTFPHDHPAPRYRLGRSHPAR